MTEYTNKFTLDGRVKPDPIVTAPKVKYLKNMIEQAMTGDRLAKGRLEETLTTSDAIFSYAYLTTINLLPQFDRAPRKWDQIAGVRVVNDFRKPVLYSLVRNWNQPGVLNNGSGSGQFNGAAPVIPELEPYPEVHFTGEEAIAAALQKRGVETSFSFESWINDSLGMLDSLPSELLRIALDSDEFAIFNSLVTVLSGNSGAYQLAGGTTPDGTTVQANAALSRQALIRALYERSQRRINGNYIQINGNSTLIVAQGQAAYAQWILSQNFAAYNEGTGNFPKLVFNVGGYDPLNGLQVLETPYLSGTQWALVPNKGTTDRPFIEMLRLRGHEGPELRVEDVRGQYAQGGGDVPFGEGSFQNDDVKMRLRLFNGSAFWTPQLGVWSRGDNSAVS